MFKNNNKAYLINLFITTILITSTIIFTITILFSKNFVIWRENVGTTRLIYLMVLTFILPLSTWIIGLILGIIGFIKKKLLLDYMFSFINFVFDIYWVLVIFTSFCSIYGINYPSPIHFIIEAATLTIILSFNVIGILNIKSQTNNKKPNNT